MLEAAYHQVVEAGRPLGEYAAGVEHDPARLEAVRRRLDLLFRLKRKYGPGLADVMETGRRVRAELDELDASSLDLDALGRRVAGARKELADAAGSWAAAGRRRRRGSRSAWRRSSPSSGCRAPCSSSGWEPLDEPGRGGRRGRGVPGVAEPRLRARPWPGSPAGASCPGSCWRSSPSWPSVDRVPIARLRRDRRRHRRHGGRPPWRASSREVAERHQVFVITHLPQLACRGPAPPAGGEGAGDGMHGHAGARAGRRGPGREIARMLGGDPESSASRDHARELLAGVVMGRPGLAAPPESAHQAHAELHAGRGRHGARPHPTASAGPGRPAPGAYRSPPPGQRHRGVAQADAHLVEGHSGLMLQVRRVHRRQPGRLLPDQLVLVLALVEVPQVDGQGQAPPRATAARAHAGSCPASSAPPDARRAAGTPLRGARRGARGWWRRWTP